MLRRPILVIGLLASILCASAQEPNRVVEMQGDDAHVSFPASLLDGLDELTVEGWFQWNRFTDFGPALSLGQPWRMIGLNNRRTAPILQFYGYDTARNVHLIRIENILELDRWYHLAGVFHGDGLQLYLNGVLVGQTAFPEPLSKILGEHARFLLGRSLWEGNPSFVGRVDNLRFWETARTAAQIQAGMHQEISGQEPGLRAAYSFTDGQATDASPNQHDGFLQNGAHVVSASRPMPEDTPAPTVLSGRILDPAGNPVFRAQVRLETEHTLQAQAETDAEGFFNLILFASQPSYDLAATWQEWGTWQTHLTVHPGHQSLPDLRLAPAFSLSGQTVSQDLEPLPNIYIQMLTAAENELATGASSVSVVATARSDEKGQYQFINVKPGAYHVRCLAPGRHVYWHENQPPSPPLTNDFPLGNLVQIRPETTVSNINFQIGSKRNGHWRVLNFMDGMPGNNVLALAQDEQGYLWLGTEYSGAARYDGRKFVSYTTKDGLPDNKINTIYAAPEGVMWFGTTAGLARLQHGAFTVFDTSNGLPDNYVERLLPASDGTLWIGTRGGLSQWNGQAFKTWDISDGLAGDHVYDLAWDQEGRLWAATDSGASRLSGSTWQSFTTSEGLVENSLRSVKVAEDGMVWFGSSTRGLSQFDGHHFTTHDESNGLIDNEIHALHIAKNGVLWIATQTGVSRLSQGAFLNFDHADGLANGPVWCLANTSDGLLWFGTRGGGVATLEEDSFLQLDARDGIAGSQITSLSREPNGALWIGAVGGITRYEGEAIQSFTTRDGLPDPRVNTVSAVAPHKVWVGTQRGVALVDDGQVAKAERFPALQTGNVQSIAQGDGETAWFAVYGGGLHFFDGQNVGRYEKEAGTGGGFLRAVYRDPQGVLLTGSREITEYTHPTSRHYDASMGLNTAEIYDLQTDAQGTLWVGTKTGLLRKERGRFEPISMGDGLTHNAIYSISLAPDGKLWMGSDAGLSVYDGTNWNRLDTRDGLSGNRIRATWCDEDGSVWAGTENGLTRYRPATHQTRAHITALETSEGMRNPEETARVQAGASVTISYAAIDFRTHPEKHLFRTLLQPLRPGEELSPEAWTWSSATHQPSMAWRPAQAGRYLFAVQYLDRDLNYSKPKFLTLEVFLPWPSNPWIVTPLAGAVLALLIVTAFSTWNYYVKRRESILSHARMVAQETFARKVIDQQESERQRIAAEIHDSLGQSLLVMKNRALLGLQENAEATSRLQQLQEISNTASQAIAEAREIAFNLRPHQLDSLGLEKGISAMANKVCRASGLSLSTNIEPQSDQLTPEGQIHCFRIVQESLNNIVKHAQATEVRLSFTKKERALLLEIHDNGQGMTDVKPSPKNLAGSGMPNIEERVKYLNGTLRIESHRGKGTSIQVSIPLPPPRPS